MRKKQTENRRPDASPSLDDDEALSRRSDRSSASEDLGEFASEVQSFLAHRSELLRRLNLEIESTERKLLELRQTKERLFPEGTLNTILSEPERGERKAKRTTKSVKAPPASPDLQTREESARNESVGGPVIHRIDNDFEADETTVPQIAEHGVGVHLFGSNHTEAARGEGTPHSELYEDRRDYPPLTFHPGSPTAAVRTAFDATVANLQPAERPSTTHSQPNAIMRHCNDSAPLLSVEPGLVLPNVKLGQMYSRWYRTQRFLPVRSRRSRRKLRWSREEVTPAVSSWRKKVARKQMRFEFVPLFSSALAADEGTGLRKAPRVLRYTRLPKAHRDRTGMRRTYKPRPAGSNQRLLPLSWRHDSQRVLLKQARTAA